MYYDLLHEMQKHQLSDVGIIRIEQLYPFPKEEVAEEINKFKHISQVTWVQEEPRNQGAWFYMQSRMNLSDCIHPDQHLHYVGRDYSASPAAGYMQLHRQQQAGLVKEALGLMDSSRTVQLKSVS